MKNQEIIAKAAISIGLLSAEEAEKRLQNEEDIPLHTIQGWRLRGDYKVKDGIKPFEVKLWKSRKMVDFTLQEHTYIRKSKCRKLNRIYSTERLK